MSDNEVDDGSEYGDEGPVNKKEEVKMTIDDDAEKDGGEDEMESALSDDIYSMMFTSKAFGGPFIFAIAVFMFQLSLTLLILVDLISRGSDNPLNIPPGVTNRVTAAAGLSVILLLAVQEDMIEGMVMLMQGFAMNKNKDFDDLTRENPNATAAKWFLASFLQFCAGTALLVVIFILIMQSTTILGMMLNFAALGFVAEIDNVAFSLAERGFISNDIQKETENVANFEMKKNPASESNGSRRILFFAVLAGLYGGYGYLVYLQKSGHFICKRIGVQFGDAYDSFLTPMSGVYKQGDSLVNGKVAYYQDSEPYRAMIAYCPDEEAWTFSWWADPSWESIFTDPEILGFPADNLQLQSMFKGEDPCNWSAKSPPAKASYDIFETDLSQWQVVNQEIPDGDFFFDHISMWCADCSGDSASGSECDGHGSCVDNACVCDEGYYGSSCEFDDLQVCPYLALDQRVEGGDVFTYEWVIMDDSDGKHVLLHDRPVYTSPLDGNGTVLVSTYNGRRWLVGVLPMSHLNFLIENAKQKKDQGNILQMPVEEYFGSFAGSTMDSPDWLLTSVPVDRETASYAYTPVGLTYYEIESNTLLGWFNQQPDHAVPFDVPLLCANCTSLNNQCYYNWLGINKCLNTATGEEVGFKEFGTCDCADGYFGFLCEKEQNCIEDLNGECFNGGTCVLEGEFAGYCDCTGTGAEGPLCQFLTNETAPVADSNTTAPTTAPVADDNTTAPATRFLSGLHQKNFFKQNKFSDFKRKFQKF